MGGGGALTNTGTSVLSGAHFRLERCFDDVVTHQHCTLYFPGETRSFDDGSIQLSSVVRGDAPPRV